MPTRIKIEDGGYMAPSEDPFTYVADDQDLVQGDLILSLTRFQAEGDRLLSEGRSVGVRLRSDEEVEVLAYDLPRIAVVALEFPKFRDGRPYSNARILRERYGYKGEVRAVGEVLREQAGAMVRCGFDAFAVTDDSDPAAWAAAASRYRHVYQRAADQRTPVFAVRGGASE